MILGVNTSHDAAFALVEPSGAVRWLLEEERFNRRKHTHFHSVVALERAIATGELDPSDVDEIAFGFEDESPEHRERRDANVLVAFGPTVLARARTLDPPAPRCWSATLGIGRLRPFAETETALLALFPSARKRAWNHHMAHAAGAWLTSPFPDPAVLVVDGAGRLETATLWRAGADGLVLLLRVELPHSVGFFYWLASCVLAMEEGKVMGLAAYGEPRFLDILEREVFGPGPGAGFSLRRPLLAWGTLDATPAVELLAEAVGLTRRRSSEDPLGQVHADFACSVQRVAERVILHLCRQAAELGGRADLVLSGGVVQNSVAIGCIARSGLFRNTWVQPAPHDAGTALGAALLSARERGGATRPTIVSAFLGLPITGIDDALCRTRTAANTCADPATDAARALAGGAVVAWVRGRAEVGPRALGARSLLAHPRYALNHFRLNQIKGREPWRPLASVFRLADLERFASHPAPSPFMNLCVPLRPEAAVVLPAAVHADGSARVQTVERGDAGGLCAILDALEALGEVPCVLNTSLNGPGEPLVQTPLEAIRLFALTEVDLLFLGDRVVHVRPQLDCSARGALAAISFIQRWADIAKERVVLLEPDDGEGKVQSRRVGDLLEWLNVAHRVASSADGSASGELTISFRPSRDVRTARGVSEHAAWAIVYDDGWVVPIAFSELRAQIARNLAALEASARGLRRLAWMGEGAWRRFALDVDDPRWERMAAVDGEDPDKVLLVADAAGYSAVASTHWSTRCLVWPGADVELIR